MNPEKRRRLTPMRSFLGQLECKSDNGLRFNDVYLPEEVVNLILAHLDGKDLLRVSLVCCRWFNMVRRSTLWCARFERIFNKKAKNLPWYVYYALFEHSFFDVNLIKKANGEQGCPDLQLVYQGSTSFNVRQSATGGPYVPVQIGVFDETAVSVQNSYGNVTCDKKQVIVVPPLCSHIMDVYKPHIYVSEWIGGRFENRCTLFLLYNRYGYDEETELMACEKINPPLLNREREWFRVDMFFDEYPDGVLKIIFHHDGQNFEETMSRPLCPKMAGGVVKILFDTINPVPEYD